MTRPSSFCRPECRLARTLARAARPANVAVRRLCCWLALLAGGAALAQAQPPMPPEAPAAAPVTASALLPGERLPRDGRLDHPAWQRAAVHRQFFEKAPDLGATPRHATELRVLFDDQALYLGVRAFDPDPAQIRAPLVRHDGVNRTQDFVVAYIDAIGQRQSAQFFRINAAGSLADGMHTAADDSEDFAPDFDWSGAAHRDAQGYTAVLRIPFASLRFTGAAQGPWRIMVARRVPREQFYLHSSVLIPRDAPSFIDQLQPLLGVQLPERHAFLTLRPSLTWRSQRRQTVGAPVQQDQAVDPSLDIKWRPRPEWVLDATLNPDFSQVALDVPQLAGNTRFALSLAEKRPFFFESSDLLRSPTEAMYTRAYTEPRWGLRSTWRGQCLAGTAFVLDDRGGGQVLLPGPFGTGVAEQPPSTALAVRGRLDGQALQWGALLSARHYGQGRGDNLVLGPDLAWQMGPAWRLRAQWLQSATSAQPQAQADGRVLLQQAPTVGGHRAYLRLNYQAPLREAELGVDDIGRDFRHDAGFVNQSGVTQLKGRLGQGWLGLGPLNELWLNLEAEATQARAGPGSAGGGRLVSRGLNPGLWLAGPHNLEASLYWHGADALRPAAGAPLLHPRFWKLNLVFTPAPWAPLLSTDWSFGRLADVSAQQVRRGASGNVSLSLRPLPNLELEPRLSSAWLRDGGRVAYRETAGQLLAVWHLGPQQSLRAIGQRSSYLRLAGPGGVEAREHSRTGSLTYSWRASAGTVLYVGASRERQGRPLTQRGDELFIKLQLDVDEARRWF